MQNCDNKMQRIRVCGILCITALWLLTGSMEPGLHVRKHDLPKRTVFPWPRQLRPGMWHCHRSLSCVESCKISNTVDSHFYACIFWMVCDFIHSFIVKKTQQMCMHDYERRVKNKCLLMNKNKNTKENFKTQSTPEICLRLGLGLQSLLWSFLGFFSVVYCGKQELVCLYYSYFLVVIFYFLVHFSTNIQPIPVSCIRRLNLSVFSC